jgi:rhodanese-related sulfurtransferase
VGYPEAVSAFADPEIDVDPQRVAGWLSDRSDLQLIDVREHYEREAGAIEGSRHIELERLASSAATIDRERPVVFYCRMGSRSGMAAQAFRASGYEAYSMRGGLSAWAEEERPLTPPDGYVADH